MNIMAKVLAIKRLDFKNDDGESIQGRQLWVCASSTEPAWNGHEVLKIWVPDDDPHLPDLLALINGDTVEVAFNRRGKPYVVNYTPEA